MFLLDTFCSTATNFEISCCKTVDQVIIDYMYLPESMLCLLPFKEYDIYFGCVCKGIEKRTGSVIRCFIKPFIKALYKIWSRDQPIFNILYFYYIYCKYSNNIFTFLFADLESLSINNYSTTLQVLINSINW